MRYIDYLEATSESSFCLDRNEYTLQVNRKLKKGLKTGKNVQNNETLSAHYPLFLVTEVLMIMQYKRRQIIFGLSLLILSALIYLIHYAVFRDAHHILIYLVGDIAFLPIEVLLVSVILHRLLSYMERRNRMEKLNMMISVFFVKMGTSLLTYLSDLDLQLESIKSRFVVKENWSDGEFSELIKSLATYSYKIDMEKVDLEYICDFLGKEREFLMRLVENPILLEHESFTDLLLAISHLAEELAARPNLRDLPASDLMHLQGDIKRAYSLLVREWIDYMRYLKKNYPYLFSLAMRTNPFDQAASPIVH